MISIKQHAISEPGVGVPQREEGMKSSPSAREPPDPLFTLSVDSLTPDELHSPAAEMEFVADDSVSIPK